MPTLYHHICGFSMFNTLTKALHEIVSILQVIPTFFVWTLSMAADSVDTFVQRLLGEMAIRYVNVYMLQQGAR